MKSVTVAALTLLTAALAMVLPAPTAGAAVNLPPGGYLFAVLANSSLVAIDRTTEKVVNTMALSGVSSAAVAEIWTSPDQASVYVLTGSSITVVDTRSMTVKGSYLDAAGSGFDSMAVSPDGTRLYAYAAAGWVDVLELPSLTRLGQAAVGVPLSRVGGVVTANNESGYVSTGDRLKVVPRDGGPVSATFVRGDGLGSIVLIGGSLYVSPRRKLWNRSGRHPEQRHGSRARGPEHVGGDRWPDDGQP